LGIFQEFSFLELSLAGILIGTCVLVWLVLTDGLLLVAEVNHELLEEADGELAQAHGLFRTVSLELVLDLGAVREGSLHLLGHSLLEQLADSCEDLLDLSKDFLILVEELRELGHLVALE
jgi:hypothetical protein